MPQKTLWDKIGVWAFILGLVIVIIVAIVRPSTGYTPTLAIVLAIIGIIIGLLNINDHEISLFLIASITLVIASSSLVALSETLNLAGFIRTLLQGIILLVAPGAAIVSLRALYDVAKR